MNGDKVEFNTVDFVESRLLPKPPTNWQQSRLLPYTFNFVADTFNFVASFGNKSATMSIRQLIAVDFVANTVDFVAKLTVSTLF